jgi:hypothetical protein
MKSTLLIIALLIAIVSVGTCSTIWTTRSDKIDITKYLFCEQSNEKPVEIDKRVLSCGPYWVTKDYRIYKVTSDKGREYWFRFGMFSYDVEEKTASGYKKLK